MRRWILLSTLFTGFSLALAAFGPGTRAEPDIAVTQIQDYLSSKSSPLTASARRFRDAGLRYKVDPRLAIAIAGAETTFGRRLCSPNNNNAWNWFWCLAKLHPCTETNRCRESTFDSWNEGVETVTHFLKVSYLDVGRDTVFLIGQKGPLSGMRELGTECDALLFRRTWWEFGQSSIRQLRIAVSPRDQARFCPTPTLRSYRRRCFSGCRNVHDSMRFWRERQCERVCVAGPCDLRETPRPHDGGTARRRPRPHVSDNSSTTARTGERGVTAAVRQQQNDARGAASARPRLDVARSRPATPALEARIMTWWTRRPLPHGATHWSTRSPGRKLGVQHTICQFPPTVRHTLPGIGGRAFSPDRGPAVFA